jgi:hypothetical protein
LALQKPESAGKDKSGSSDTSPEKEKKVRKLFEVSGVEGVAAMNIDRVARDISRPADSPKGLAEKFRELAAG